MASWEYKVVYMDFRGRASVEGEEMFIAKDERRSTFARRTMNTLGADGWELVGVQPLWPAETSYLIFKRQGTGATLPDSLTESDHESPDLDAPANLAPTEAPTQKLEPPVL